MKNFPHQINQIPRLVQALKTFGELIQGHSQITDDGIVGDALARSGAYTFRGNGRTIEERLPEEHEKAPGSQGARTCARDLRRLFVLLGLLRDSQAAGWMLSDDAQRLIDLQPDPLGVEARAIWRTKLNGMQLEDVSGSSHPYRILLKLVGERPGIRSAYLGLCLEAADNSDEEFERIRKLAAIDDPGAMWDQLGITAHQARNSLKILPALARQVGDILESEGGYHIGQPADASDQEPVQSAPSQPRQRRRPYDSNRQRERSVEEGALTTRAFDPDAIGERWNAHERCLQQFSRLVPNEFEQYEGDYDLLIVSDGCCLLCEVKTLREDAARQIRAALGQVLYYEHIFVEPMYPDREILRLVITDGEPPPDLIALLERHNIGAAWLSEEGRAGASSLGAQFLERFDISLPH